MIGTFSFYFRLKFNGSDDYYVFSMTDLFSSATTAAVCIHGTKLDLLSKITQGQILKRLLDERVKLDTHGIIMGRHAKFYEIFNRKIQQMFDSGIVSYHVTRYSSNLNYNKFKHLYERDPKKLTMKELEAGFVVWIFAVLLTVIVFTCEWIVRFKDYLKIKYVLLAMYERREVERNKHIDITLPIKPAIDADAESEKSDEEEIHPDKQETLEQEIQK